MSPTVLRQSARSFGDEVVIVPYVMPGFDLARAVRDLWPSQVTDQTMGMVLLNHGLFTFGSTTKEAYDRHVDLITKAEDWLAVNAPSSVAQDEPLGPVDPVILAGVRHDVSRVAGVPLVMMRHDRLRDCPLRQAPRSRFARRARPVDPRSCDSDQTPGDGGA